MSFDLSLLPMAATGVSTGGETTAPAATGSDFASLLSAVTGEAAPATNGQDLTQNQISAITTLPGAANTTLDSQTVLDAQSFLDNRTLPLNTQLMPEQVQATAPDPTLDPDVAVLPQALVTSAAKVDSMAVTAQPVPVSTEASAEIVPEIKSEIVPQADLSAAIVPTPVSAQVTTKTTRPVDAKSAKTADEPVTPAVNSYATPDPAAPALPVQDQVAAETSESKPSGQMANPVPGDAETPAAKPDETAGPALDLASLIPAQIAAPAATNAPVQSTIVQPTIAQTQQTASAPAQMTQIQGLPVRAKSAPVPTAASTAAGGQKTEAEGADAPATTTANAAVKTQAGAVSLRSDPGVQSQAAQTQVQPQTASAPAAPSSTLSAARKGVVTDTDIAVTPAAPATSSGFSLVSQAATADSTGYAPAASAETSNASLMSQTAANTINALSVQINKRNAEGATKFTMELHPADLGKVDVALSIGRDGKVTAHMTFDSEVTTAAFSARESDLRQQLSATGLQLSDDALSFSTRQKTEATAQAQAHAVNANARSADDQGAGNGDSANSSSQQSQNAFSQSDTQQGQQRSSQQQAQQLAQRLASAQAAADAADEAALNSAIDASMDRLKYPSTPSRLALDLSV